MAEDAVAPLIAWNLGKAGRAYLGGVRICEEALWAVICDIQPSPHSDAAPSRRDPRGGWRCFSGRSGSGGSLSTLEMLLPVSRLASLPLKVSLPGWCPQWAGATRFTPDVDAVVRPLEITRSTAVATGKTRADNSGAPSASQVCVKSAPAAGGRAGAVGGRRRPSRAGSMARQSKLKKGREVGGGLRGTPHLAASPPTWRPWPAARACRRRARAANRAAPGARPAQAALPIQRGEQGMTYGKRGAAGLLLSHGLAKKHKTTCWTPRHPPRPCPRRDT